MEVYTKALFKLYGQVCWIDRNNEPHYLYIPEQQAIFRWAKDKARARFFFRVFFRDYLKKKSPKKCPRKLSDILTARLRTKELKSKKRIVFKQLELFKKPS